MAWEDDEPAEGFSAPLPPEDRLWRHPAEVAAAQRQAAVEVPSRSALLRTPLRHALTFALVGAAGGAMIASGLFVSLRENPAGRPITQSFALDPIVPLPIVVDADEWPAKATETTRAGIATVNVTRDSHVYVGSAVAYRSDGMLLTSADLVDDYDEVTVTTSDSTHHVGTVVGIDVLSGLALLSIDATDQPIVQLDIWSKPAIGQYAVVLSGSAEPDDLVVTTVSELGVQVALAPNLSLHGMIELAGGIPQGASGGAIVDTKGAVIGIAVDSDTSNATYAVPISYARKIADDLAKTGTARHPWIGVRGVGIPVDRATKLGIAGGVEITAVLGDSERDGGLLKGDIITAVRGQPIVSMTDLILALRQDVPGNILRLEFRHDGEREITDIVLELRETGHSA